MPSLSAQRRFLAWLVRRGRSQTASTSLCPISSPVQQGQRFQTRCLCLPWRISPRCCFPPSVEGLLAKCSCQPDQLQSPKNGHTMMTDWAKWAGLRWRVLCRAGKGIHAVRRRNLRSASVLKKIFVKIQSRTRLHHYRQKRREGTLTYR